MAEHFGTYTPLSLMVVYVCIIFDESDDSSKHGTFVKYAFQKLEKATGSSQKNPGMINAHE